MEEEKAQALAKENEVPLGVPFWMSLTDEEQRDEMDVEISLPPFTADVGGNPIRQLLANATKHNGTSLYRSYCPSATHKDADVAQVSALLSSGFGVFMSVEHYPVIVPWLFDLGMYSTDIV